MLFVYFLFCALVAAPVFSAAPYYEGKYCPGFHEHFECGSACQTTCETLGQDCPIINIKCNEGCYCDEGYARDESNTCIRIPECPRVKH